MQKKEYYCAIDLGATSGRIIIAPANGGEWIEVRRFAHNVTERKGMFFWDIDFLLSEIICGLQQLARRDDIRLLSIGVDTWGCDIIFLDKDGKPLAQPRAYRDPYTQGMIERLGNIIPLDDIYNRTGIQFMPFNTLFQLYACSQQEYLPMLTARYYMFISDYINYVLSGTMACEYTILSTSQFLNVHTKAIDAELINAVGARKENFPPVVMPGTCLGNVRKEVAPFTYDVPVIAVAGHDTASAVAAVPQKEGENSAYLSSGTWSLMGIVSPHPIISERSRQLNFTNEGGVGGSTRVLKNITGMWILEQCRKEWAAEGKQYSYDDIMKMYSSATGFAVFNPDDEVFANPASMLTAINDYCIAHQLTPPQTDAEYVRSIFESLASRYKTVFEWLQELSPFHIDKLYVIGGGARNMLLNALTQQYLGIPVEAGSTEATAEGNIKIQKQTIKS